MSCQSKENFRQNRRNTLALFEVTEKKGLVWSGHTTTVFCLFFFWYPNEGLIGFTGFYWVLLGFTGFYWFFTVFYWFLLGFTGFFLGFTGFYWVLLDFTGFY